MARGRRVTGSDRIGRIFLIFLLFLFLSGCANPEGKSRELYETAQFEEQQQNFKHARELYQRIVTQYPETPTAAKAKERLEAIKEK